MHCQWPCGAQWKHFPKHRWTHCQIARRGGIAPSEERGLGNATCLRRQLAVGWVDKSARIALRVRIDSSGCDRLFMYFVIFLALNSLRLSRPIGLGDRPRAPIATEKSP